MRCLHMRLQLRPRGCAMEAAVAGEDAAAKTAACVGKPLDQEILFAGGGTQIPTVATELGATCLETGNTTFLFGSAGRNR